VPTQSLLAETGRIQHSVDIVYYDYLLRSEKDPERFYTGFTKDLKRRLTEYNRSRQGYSKQYAPWVLTWYCGFRDESRARQFEVYLKSGSGRAFIHKHFS